MRLVSFDTLRTLGFPNTTWLKPEQLFTHSAQLAEADWVLFPDYWQINALVYGFRKRIFPNLPTYLIGHNKIEMTRAFQAVVPKHLPETRIVPNDAENAERIWNEMELPFVAKIPKSSMGEGVFLIQNRADWQKYLKISPVIYAQEWLPIDRDLRIVVVGGKVISAYWRLQSQTSFHNNIARGGSVASGIIPESAIQLVLETAAKLDINHAGFDVAMVGNHPYLFEFNRMFGNQGIEGGDIRLRDAILTYLQENSQPEDPDTPIQPEPPCPMVA